MANDKAKKLFQNYVNAATDLAESVKRNIQTDGYIDDQTVIMLNSFIISMNALAELEEEMIELDEVNDENEKDVKKH